MRIYRFTKRILVTTIITTAACTSLHAAPIISGTSGELLHGQSVTISGSNFGTKSTAAPYIWETMDNGGFSTKWRDTFRNEIDNSQNRHPRSSYHSRGHFASDNVFTNKKVVGFQPQGMPLTGKVFVNYWFRLDPNWVWGTSGAGSPESAMANIKYFRMHNTTANGGTGVAAQFHTFLGVNRTESKQNVYAPEITSGLGLFYSAPRPLDIPKGQWQLMQIEFQDSSSPGVSDGKLRIWYNGKLTLNATLRTRDASTNSTGLSAVDLIGFYNSWNIASKVFYLYFDDIYVDNSWARIELGNASTYTNSSIREVQIPTSWSPSSISFKVNQGALQNLSNAYIYVVDANGAVNQQGFALCKDCSQPPELISVE